MADKRLYVGNLAWKVREEGLRALFADFGIVQDATVIMDRETNRSKGFGYVEFDSAESAARALDELNGQDYEGRALKVSVAKRRG